MRIKFNTRVEIRRLFSCMLYGEQTAQDCALDQAAITDNTRINRFLIRQARQEAHHAKVFNRVVLCIDPRGPRQVPSTLQLFRARLQRACRNGDLVESLVGQQVVLEAFGELILHRMNKKLDQRWIGFKRLRRTLIHQEQGHLAFGDRTVRRLVIDGKTPPDHVYEVADEYLFLIEQVLDQLQPLLDVVGADADLYKTELRTGMPTWIIGRSL